MLFNFNEDCATWQNDKEFNKIFVDHTINYLNTKLSAVGWLSVNDLNDSFGKDRRLKDQVFGWKLADGLGIIEYEFVDVNDFGSNNVIVNLKNVVKLM